MLDRLSSHRNWRFLCLFFAAFTRPRPRDLRRTKQRGESYPQDYDAHPVTATVWTMPSSPGGGFVKGDPLVNGWSVAFSSKLISSSSHRHHSFFIPRVSFTSQTHLSRSLNLAPLCFLRVDLLFFYFFLYFGDYRVILVSICDCSPVAMLEGDT